jgi:hypothetical protein
LRKDAKESLQLEPVTKKRLVKTQQAEKDLARSDFKGVEIKDGAVIAFSSESV